MVLGSSLGVFRFMESGDWCIRRETGRKEVLANVATGLLTFSHWRLEMSSPLSFLGRGSSRDAMANELLPRVRGVFSFRTAILKFVFFLLT